MKRFLAVTTLALAAPQAAFAYVGPGAGLSAIGTAVAFMGALVLLIAGFVWYPVKRMIRRNRDKSGGGETETDT